MRLRPSDSERVAELLGLFHHHDTKSTKERPVEGSIRRLRWVGPSEVDQLDVSWNWACLFLSILVVNKSLIE